MAKQVSTNNTPSSLPFLPISLDNFIELSKTNQGQIETYVDEKTQLVIYPGTVSPKLVDINQGISVISLKNKGYLVAKPQVKNKRITESLLGITAADFHCKFLIITTDCLVQIASELTQIKSMVELIFLCNKTTTLEQTLELQSQATPMKLIDMMTQKWKIASTYYITANKNLHRWAFLVISLFSLIFMTQMSKTSSISGDEFTQYTYSKLIANYYLESIGEAIPIDTNELKGQRMPTLAKAFPTMGAGVATIKDPDRVMHVYGSSFDTFTTILGYYLDVDDQMQFRHWWNSIFGFFCILFTALVVRRLTQGSWAFAWLSFLIMLLMPRFFGEAMNNPKDVPFALGYIMSLYYAIRMFQNWPQFRWNNALGLVLSTALGISVRIGGLLSVAFFIMYAGLKFIEHIGFKQFTSLKWKGFGALFIATIAIGLGSYLLGISPWPYGIDQPFNNPLEALKEFTNYSVSLRQLFEGKLYDSDMLPLYYLRKYLLITTPMAVMFGLGCFALLVYSNRKRFTNEIFLILFAAIFPIVYIYIQKSQVYGGIRQILFTLPCFVTIAVIGYQWFGDLLSRLNKKLQLLPTLIALALLVMPTKFILANHPVSYSYFNEIFGGTAKAYGEFEMDYYLASLRPSAEWFLDNVARKHPEKKYEVLTYGMDHVKYYCRNDKNVHVGYSRFDDRSSKDWDYCIFYNAYFDKSRLTSGEFPPKGTVYQQMVDGVPAGLVIERPSHEDFIGIQAIEKDSAYEKGVTLLENYLKIDPARSEVQFYLSSAYIGMGNIEKAILAAKEARKYYPEYSRACFAQFQYLMDVKRYDEAIEVVSQYLDSRPRDGEGYLMKAQAQMSKGDITSGLETLKVALEVNPMDYRVYNLGAQAFQMMKDASNYNMWIQASTLGSASNQNDFQTAVQAVMMIYEEITGKPLDTKKYGLE
jgi:tetratricopeptide (TPR) repeat protein